jgi:transcriptional regulator with XRE-family HTH domain
VGFHHTGIVASPKKLTAYLEGEEKLSEFGEKLIYLRTERGLSTKEACQKMGIPQSRLSELERAVRIPTSGQITRLETFYETGSDKLANLAKLFEENLDS